MFLSLLSTIIGIVAVKGMGLKSYGMLYAPEPPEEGK